MVLGEVPSETKCYDYTVKYNCKRFVAFGTTGERLVNVCSYLSSGMTVVYFSDILIHVL